MTTHLPQPAAWLWFQCWHQVTFRAESNAAVRDVRFTAYIAFCMFAVLNASQLNLKG